jgi:hypothetical protein
MQAFPRQEYIRVKRAKRNGKGHQIVTLGVCAYCDNWRRLTCDHILPKCMLDSTAMTRAESLANIARVCGWCNQSKGSKTLAEWLATLPARAPQHRIVGPFL